MPSAAELDAELHLPLGILAAKVAAHLRPDGAGNDERGLAGAISVPIFGYQPPAAMLSARSS